MKRIYCCFALALGLPLGALGAQETPALGPGARVRVTAPDEWHRVVGSLETIDSTTIVVRRANGTTVAFPRERGTRLDLSGGPGACGGGDRGGCIVLGFLGGAGVGALAGAMANHSCATGPGDRSLCGLAFLVMIPAGAVVGTVVGAVVGGEHWKRTPLPARLSVGPDGSGRFAVGLSLRF
jgi:hypothetical protein